MQDIEVATYDQSKKDLNLTFKSSNNERLVTLTSDVTTLSKTSIVN